jgi:hypothetical protein
MSVRTGTVRFGMALLAGFAMSLAANAADKLLPDKSEVVASINIKALVDSDIAKNNNLESQIRDGIKNQPQAQAILSELGLDPLKDIHSITLGMAGLKPGRNGDNTPDELLIIIHGSFDQNRIESKLAAYAAAEPSKLAIANSGRSKIYEFKEKKPSNFAAFADAKTIVASPKSESVEAALSKGSSQLSSSLTSLLSKVDEKASVWAVVGKEAFKNIPQAAAVPPNISGVTITINVQKDIKLEALLHMTDAAAAKNLSDQLQQYVGLLPALVQQNPDTPKEVVESLNSLKVTDKGSAVCASLEITGEAIRKLMEEGKKSKGK